MKNQEKIFALFVGKEPLRPELHVAFRDGDYVFASDNHAIVRVAVSEVDNLGLYEGINVPSRHLFDKKDNCCEQVTLARMKKALKELPAYRDCPECGGRGAVDFVYEDQEGNGYSLTHDCPVCEGRGHIMRKHVVKIGKHFFTMQELVRLRETATLLGQSKVTQVYESEGINIFRVTDTVYIGMMCTVLGKKNPIIV